MNYKSSKRRFLAPLKTEKKLVATIAPTQGFSPRTSSYQSNQSHRSHQSNQRVSSKNFPVRKKIATPIPPPGDNIRIIPLGGVEEIGKNMTVVEYKGDIIVIDCGMQFSTEDTPGIDYLLPNTTYLEERKDKIRAVIITHGHLDHIGAIPFLINRLGNPPIWCREFGALLIQKRQLEHPHLPALNMKIVGADDGTLPISANLKVRFFGLTHSIPDSTGVIIETPEGDLVFTGDVRVENKDGVPTEKEIEQYKIFKDRDILLLAMDSTGIDFPGWCLSESVVIETVDKIVAEAPGRIIIATFSSQVERIIGFIEIARKYGRKVAIDGRSMKTNLEIIKQLRLAEIKHAVSIEESNNFPPHKIMILATGAQGEEFASLMRMATGTHKQIKLQKSDTIILSSSVIPGNETAVITLKDNLYRHDVKVITVLDSNVHASGHGKRGELEWIHKQIKYKFFMPIHGFHYKLKMHAELARTFGVPRENVIVPDDGSIIEIEKGGKAIKKLKEKAPSASMMVDGFSVGDVQEVVIRDRQLMAEDGMFVIIASVNSSTGHLKKSPDIISRGFVYLRESQALLQETRLVVKRTVEEATAGMRPINFEYVKTILTENVSRFLFQKTAKRPIVIPVVLGV